MKRVHRFLVMALVLILASVSGAFAYQDVTPAEAYALATSNPNVYILDVRTIAEWTWVGHPGVNKPGDGAELEGKVVNISYEIDRHGELVVNPVFVLAVKKAFCDNPDAVLVTMCRSGSRSVKAAMALEEAGFANVLNMATGFEGGKDALGYRTVNGWKVDGLPYNFNTEGAYTFWQPFQK